LSSPLAEALRNSKSSATRLASQSGAWGEIVSYSARKPKHDYKGEAKWLTNSMDEAFPLAN